MSTSRHSRRDLSILRQLRLLGFGRSPLRRRVDRVESLLLLGALVAALLVIPVAARLGTTVRDRAEHTAVQQRAGLHPVQARTLENTSAVASSLGRTVTKVRVMWFDTSGSRQEGWAAVVIGTRAGAEVAVWLDRTGAMARGPRACADSAALGVAAGGTVAMFVWTLLVAVFRSARRLLDRRRAREWARDWEQVSPRWTRPQC